MVAPLAVLHLRHASGGGGGADAALFQDLAATDAALIRCQAVYLRKKGEPPALMIGRLRGIGVACSDLPGRAVLDVGQVLAIARLARASEAKLIHCHDPKSDVYGYLLRRLCPGVSLVCTLHGWTVKVRREIAYNWLAMQALKRFDAVLAVSDDLRRKALAAGLRRVRLVSNAIDVAVWRRGVAGRPAAGGGAAGCAVGFVGRLSPEKGAVDFVRTARRVADRDGTCKFFVAGEGPEKEAMVSLAAEAGLADRITFLGHLDEEPLRELYRRLDVVLLTSHTEGLPMVVLESFAMSLPVVATRVGGVGEVVSHGTNGLLSEPGDPDGLAGQVLRLAQDAPLRERYGAAGRKLVEERHSLQARTAALVNIYQGLAAGGELAGRRQQPSGEARGA